MSFVFTEPISTAAENGVRGVNCKGSHDLAVRIESERGFALLAEATRVLAATNSFEEIKGLRDKAEAVRVFARAANLNLELQNKAAELKLRAERKAGQVLQKMKLRGGDRKSNSHRDGLKLADLGLTENQSRRWQRESLVPEATFCRYIASAREMGREITAAGLLKLAAGTPATHRSTRRDIVERPATSTAGGASSTRFAKDILIELLEHHRLLADVLQPVCDGSSLLQPHSRRVVRYLLNEIKKLLEGLA